MRRILNYTLIAVLGVGVLTASVITFGSTVSRSKGPAEAASNQVDPAREIEVLGRLLSEARNQQRQAEIALITWKQQAEIEAAQRVRAELAAVKSEQERFCAPGSLYIWDGPRLGEYFLDMCWSGFDVVSVTPMDEKHAAIRRDYLERRGAVESGR